MTERPRVSRRRVLALSGSALSVGVAGCTSSSDDGTGSSDESDRRQPLEPADWEDVSEIRLDGYTNGWIGVEPGLIAGVKNPSLLLFEGEEYDLTWTNRDGIAHNVAIRDDGRRVVDGNRTGRMETRGKAQTLTFEATEAMHEYVCEPHARLMIGYVHVES